MFARNVFRKEAVVHESEESFGVLEVVFEGKHTRETAKEMSSFLEEAIEQRDPRVVIVNLLGYRYEWGKEIGGALIRGRQTLWKIGTERQFRVLASGKTARGLANLFKFTGLDTVFPEGFFEDFESALIHAQSELKKSV